ncbi:O-antigen ligase family protein (plasmid) [Aliiroseovarius sp. M344]|uniref:O-antigen ligase family protein n=1 Tax=Aliiroseovarius sp. M344 TaxID=2867010 RepID=UPI0021AD7256|nr:O-antigen ligase family protein [Aliiroseovarius sp. M344]UWQ16056.1 O-antigen ligase family protein [Aliiroseovarius sp. M344]
MARTIDTIQPDKAEASVKTADRVLIALLVFSFVMPFYFFFGELRLSIYRIYLLVFAGPIFYRWIKGDAGRIRAIDVYVILASFWVVLSLMVVHGAEKAEFAGITAIETLIPYLTARVLIRSYAAFKTFVWWHFVAIMILLPFAIYESVTNKAILIDSFRGIFSVYVNANHEPRLGLYRAQASMPHPILFGVFATPAFALSWYVLGNEGSFFKKFSRPVIAGANVFTSLSSAAFLGIVLQIILMAWDRVLISVKSRWVIFGVIFGTLYTVLELSSNRNAFQIIASELSFSSGTAYNRILIFNHAVDDIARNPIFGIGLNDWTRPYWMKPSIDNFWLVHTIRHGLPMLAFMSLAILTLFVQLVMKPLSGKHADARTGFLIVLASLILCASTVHLWDATYCLLMFLLGAAVWMLDYDPAEETTFESTPADQSGIRTQMRYTRFGKKPMDQDSAYARFNRS